jgi:para-nitrobenzyl esterase
VSGARAVLALAAAYVSAACASVDADPTLRTVAQGELTGAVQANGSLVWRSIPYAEPPVGALRWKAPRPAGPWHGVYSAVDVIQPCVQFASGLTAGIPDPDGDGLVGSEDCLYLSVYAPSDAPELGPLPVMYWIFGGGNNSGYAGDYDAAHLAESQKVVVVAVNYRLGALGWFLHPAIVDEGSTGADASGNWGTLDTVLGLEWVRDNIAAFGGDPDNVTIFGESAGGGNVMSLVTSPLGEGLFHQAIVQSGGVGTTTVADGVNYIDDEEPGHVHSSREIVNMILVRDGRAADRKEAKALQEEMSDTEIRTLLHAQPAPAFLRLYNPEGSRNYPAPKKFMDGTVFAERDPHEQLASGDHHQVPIILGTNRDERRIYMYGQWADVIRSDPDEYVRISRYPSHRVKLRGVDELARTMAPAQDPPVYAYRFDWDEQATTPDGLDMAIAIGAAHSTEMAFVFGNWDVGFIDSDRLYDPATNPGRDKLSDAMMSYWANFAYTGRPGRGRDGTLPEWRPWENGDGKAKMLVFDSENDGGIRMSIEEMTLESIKAEFLTEGFSSQENRCNTYRETFAGTPEFDPREYAGLGCPTR